MTIFQYPTMERLRELLGSPSYGPNYGASVTTLMGSGRPYAIRVGLIDVPIMELYHFMAAGPCGICGQPIEEDPEYFGGIYYKPHPWHWDGSDETQKET